MKKAYTVYLEPETYEKLKAFSEKKKWSLTQSMEYILQKIVNKPNVKQKSI
jgi:predicted DNA-binding protein